MSKATEKMRDKLYTAREIERYHDLAENMLVQWGGRDSSTSSIDLLVLFVKHERAVCAANTRACNEEGYDPKPARSKAFKAIRKALPELPENAFLINSDPRSHALKIDDEWLKSKIGEYAFLSKLQTDWGGYGLLCCSELLAGGR
jgi:hypothetical protein